MRSLRELLSPRPAAAKVEAPAQIIPPPIPPVEKRELQRATVRIERKWRTIDAILNDYREQDRFYGHRS